MQKILDWLKPRQSKPSSTGLNQQPRPGGESRESRADHVTQMRVDVSRLQQEILALSQTDQGAAAKQSAMTRLEHELATAQRELAKLQGRV